MIDLGRFGERRQAITKADQNIWGMQMIAPGILTKGNFVWRANHSDFKKSMLDAPGVD